MATIGGPQQCTQGVLRKVLARLHNWVLLVKEVLKAELPEFETFSSMHSLLQLEHAVNDTKVAAKRMASLLQISAAAELLFGGVINFELAVTVSVCLSVRLSVEIRASPLR